MTHKTRQQLSGRTKDPLASIINALSVWTRIEAQSEENTKDYFVASRARAEAVIALYTEYGIELPALNIAPSTMAYATQRIEELS